jgi:dihydroneopterin aldolase
VTAGSQAGDEGRPALAPFGAVAAAQRIVVRDLTVSSNIGVSSEERARPQRIRINLEVEIEPRIPISDKITEVVNYGPLVGRVRAICAESRARLLETLAAEVAKICFLDDRVRVVSLRIEKLDRYPDVGGVGVAIVYHRDGA